MLRGGPHYHHLRELLHLVHETYEAGKKVFDELYEEGSGERGGRVRRITMLAE
jgi:hypothetical protein